MRPFPSAQWIVAVFVLFGLGLCGAAPAAAQEQGAPPDSTASAPDTLASAAPDSAQAAAGPCIIPDPSNPDCDNSPDVVPPSAAILTGAGPYASASLAVSINYSDERELAGPTMTLRGVNVTSSFTTTYSGSPATSATSNGTITLIAGNNLFSTTICDGGGNCDTDSRTFVYDATNPTVSISPASGGLYTSASLAVTVSWGDNLGLNSASRSITLNGVNKTSSFGYTGSATSASSTGTVTLASGSNTLVAQICDNAGRCTSKTATYTYDGSAPTVAITPASGGTYTSASLASTISWGDNLGLNSASRSIKLNGVDKTSSFSYTGSATSATSTGTVTLAPGANTLSAQICDNAGNCTTKSATYTYNSPDYKAPTIGLTPHNGDDRNTALCAADCFDATASYTLAGYVSFDQERTVTLFYTSAQAAPRGYVQLDASDASTTAPAKMSLQLKDANGAWVTFINGSQELFYLSGAGTTRLAAQFDASGLATGAYTYTVVVRSRWSDGVVSESSLPVRVLVVNEKDSPFGWGWTLAGYQRLHFGSDGSKVITEGDGSALYFAKVGSSYTAPAGDFTTLSASGSQYKRSYPDGTVVTFAADGLLVSSADRFGNTTSFTHDTSGKLTQIADPAGKTITFTYSGSKVIDIRPAGNIRAYLAYDASGNLQSIKDKASGYPLVATYDTQHRLLSRTDRGGGKWGYAYDYTGKLAADTLPSVTVGGASVRPVVGYRSSEVATHAGSGNGTLAAPAPRPVPTALRAEVTTPRGHTTKLALDRWGAAVSVEEPLARTTTITRDASARVTQVQTPAGGSTTYSWNGAKLTQSSDAVTGQTITYEYGVYDQLSRVSGQTAEVVRTLNSLGQVQSMSIAGGASTTYTYDAKGRLKTAVDPEQHQTTYFYDATAWKNTDSVRVGAVASSKPRRVARYKYDSMGRAERSYSAENDSTLYVYNVLNQVTKVTGPLNDATSYAFNSGLYLTKVTDAKGQVYSFAPNALGWMTSETAGGGSKTYTYDLNGNVLSAKNRRGQTVSFTYDELDQPTGRTADGATTTYKSDPKGLYQAASNAASTDTLRYDAAGRLTQQVSRGITLVSTYDSWNLRTKLQKSKPTTGAAVTYAYNALGQLQSINDLAGKLTTLRYNSDHLLDLTTLPSGLQIAEGYISNHGKLGVEYTDAALDDALGLSYAQNPKGFISSRYNAAGDRARSYGYDPTGRLLSYKDESIVAAQYNCGTQIIDPDTGATCVTQGQRTTLASAGYTYDAVGNRTDSGAATSYSYNRPPAFAGYTLTYDADGNLKSKSKSGYSQSYTWNSLSQLTQVLTNGSTATYTYDGFGRRIKRVEGGRTHSYVYDGDQIAIETDANGATVAEYTYYPGVDEPHSVRLAGQNTQLYYYASEELGHVTGLIDATSNALKNRYDYTPWGERQSTSSETVSNPFQYAGREYDAESALYYNRARYYDPQLGRFLSEDPIGLEGGINLYVYAGDNPVNFLDPYGLDCKDGQFVDEQGNEGVMGCAKKGGDGREKGTTDNFGNPCARGGHCGGGGTTGGGGGAGGGAAKADPKPKISKQCAVAGALFAASLAGDVVLTGALVSAAATALSVGSLAAPVVFVTGAAVGGGLVTRAVPRISGAFAAAAMDYNFGRGVSMASTATGAAIASNTELMNVSEAHGLGSRPTDLLPYLGTRNAYRSAKGACGAQ